MKFILRSLLIDKSLGPKGMILLDSHLVDECVSLRLPVIKFKGSESMDIEL
jgi:hypothetical protein